MSVQRVAIGSASPACGDSWLVADGAEVTGACRVPVDEGEALGGTSVAEGSVAAGGGGNLDPEVGVLEEAVVTGVVGEGAPELGPRVGSGAAVVLGLGPSAMVALAAPAENTVAITRHRLQPATAAFVLLRMSRPNLLDKPR